MSQNEKNNGEVLGKKNYILLSIGLVILIIGYVLLSGGKSPDPKIFSEELFSATRLTVAPILIILGFTIDVIAIVLKPKD